MRRCTAPLPTVQCTNTVLEIAFYNWLQHVQFQHVTDRLVLACDAARKWDHVIDPQFQVAGPSLDVRVQGDAIYVQLCDSEGEIGNDQQSEWLAELRFELPAAFTLGDTWFEIDQVAPPIKPTRKQQELHRNRSSKRTTSERGPAPATLTRWLEALGTLHRQTASSPEFFAEAARFVVDPIGLDGAIILRRQRDQWQIVGSHLPRPELGIRYDRRHLDCLLESPRTQFEGAGASRRRRVEVVRSADELESRLQQAAANDNPSCDQPSRSVVVAPLLDEAGVLIGAVYGFRAQHTGNGRRWIRPLEARLVDVLASSLNAGIARLECELAAVRQRALFEQAFSPAVADVLERDPTALMGQERELTVLFADLRNFSSICAALGARDSYSLLSEVMDCFTGAVMEHDGVVIDYYGDGLAAMWNAPLDQPQHAEQACRTALDMVQTLTPVSKRWYDRLARELRLGVGIHTGPATVGNVGSRRRLKYGPRGATVNLAARVEAATKKLRLPVLITRATAKRLSSELTTFRVCRADLSGIPQATDLYAVTTPVEDRSTFDEWDRYENILTLYEAGELELAEKQLANVTFKNEAVPFRFLADEIQSCRSRRLGRRGTDVTFAITGTAIVLEKSP